MTAEKVAIGTILILVFSNLVGLIYSLVVLKTSIFKAFRIQKQDYKAGLFKSRMPLFLFNFITLLVFSGSGAYFLFDFIDTSGFVWYIVLGQVLIAFLVDDLFFYFYHRYLHENKFLLKHIHSIHHRATKPFPLEYLYAHPLEWMIGTLGVVFGFALILIFMKINLYAFWIFGLLRNLHEIHIHSDLKLPGLSTFPFLSKTEHHDLHHSKLNGNYASTFLIWDKILGTTFKSSEK
jgi:sterol desaturase/sphingolipid hydroxylase (fatty acid hydroxylase superfamily)